MATLDELQQQLAALSARVDALTTPPDDYYTSKYSGEEIDAGIEKTGSLPESWPLPIASGGTGADTAQLALANLGGRPNPNLLDNWYFVGGGSQKGYGIFPINQQGKTNYTSQQTSPLTIDRWHADWNLTLDITENGLSMSGGGIFQYLIDEIIKYIAGKTITISVLYSDGNFATQTGSADETFGTDALKYSIDYSGGKNAVRCIGSIAAAKLEVGNKQTLCYQDADGKWKLFEKPDYQQILMKCLSHMVQLKPNAGSGIVQNATTAYVEYPLTVPLDISRGNPVLTCDYSKRAWTTKDMTEITSAELNGNYNGETVLCLTLKGDFTGVTPGTVITTYLFAPLVTTAE